MSFVIRCLDCGHAAPFMPSSMHCPQCNSQWREAEYDMTEVASTFPYQDRIDASTRAVQEMGAGGVPAFVIADRVLIPGAQPHSLFDKVMQRLELESVESTDDSPAASS